VHQENMSSPTPPVPNWAPADATEVMDSVSLVHATEVDTSLVRRKRGRRLFEAFGSAVASKGVIVLVNLVSIPIVIRYLGAEQFGVWTTITTSLVMLLVLDLGVANSLTNFISEAYARDDREYAARYATTALVIMSCIAICLGGIGLLVWPHINWFDIFHLASRAETPSVSGAVAAAFAIFLIDLPSRLSTKILGGYQEVRTVSLFTALGGIGNLISIVLLVHFHAGLAAMVAGSTGAIVGADLLCLIWLVSLHKPWLFPRLYYVSRSAGRRMMQLGVEFFLIQIAGLVVFNSDNLVITHYLGPAEVARYSVAWRLVGYAAIVQTLITPGLWPAFTEAFDRGDFSWVRKAFRHILTITMSVALVFVMIFAFSGRSIIRVWATQAAVPSQELMLLMCLWVLISTFMNNTATVLVSRGHTRVQAWCSVAAAALNLALSIWLVQRIGAVGVILGTIVSYLAVLIIPQTIETWRVLYPRISDSPAQS
jgi:O-antigen/teichoic acid export membrane protein